MNREQLERLAANPHYKMTPQQLAELSRLRGNVQHSTEVPLHDPTFRTHETEPPKEADGQPD